MKNMKLIILSIALTISTLASAQWCTQSPTSVPLPFDAPQRMQISMGSSMPMSMATGSNWTNEVYNAGAYNIFETPEATEERIIKEAIRKGFITPDDPNRSNESPIGAPWIMLLFAAVAAGVVTYKRHLALTSSQR